MHSEIRECDNLNKQDATQHLDGLLCINKEPVLDNCVCYQVHEMQAGYGMLWWPH
jgi:hypothetical protein